jgi:hypothetical protein
MDNVDALDRMIVVENKAPASKVFIPGYTVTPLLFVMLVCVIIVYKMRTYGYKLGEMCLKKP